jgi:hypothetical protein
MTADARTWIERYAKTLGIEPPSAAEVETLLAVAGVAAHASERTAAPVSCWVAATARKSADEALALAKELAATLER